MQLGFFHPSSKHRVRNACWSCLEKKSLNRMLVLEVLVTLCALLPGVVLGQSHAGWALTPWGLSVLAAQEVVASPGPAGTFPPVGIPPSDSLKLLFGRGRCRPGYLGWRKGWNHYPSAWGKCVLASELLGEKKNTFMCNEPDSWWCAAGIL